MEHGHYNLKSGFMLLGVHIHRDTAAVILNGYGTVLVDGHLDVCAVAGHGLVDGVVDYLIYQVVQALLADVTYIHCRALAHCLQALQNLNVLRGIISLSVDDFFCHFERFLRHTKIIKMIDSTLFKNDNFKILFFKYYSTLRLHIGCFL